MTSRLRRRTLPSPATVSRNSDVVKEIPQRSPASRRRDVDRQASEIERLVKLAEQFAADAQRRQQSPIKSSTTAKPMREQTEARSTSTQRQRPAKNVYNDVILVTVARATTTVSAMASDSRRCRSTQSPLTLSQLLDVKSLQRCPKCHKVRVDVSSTSRDVGSAQSHNRGSGGYNSRLVRFKQLYGDSPSTTATTGHSRSRKTRVKATEPFPAKTASSTTSPFIPSRRSTVSATFNRDVDKDQGQGCHIPARNTAAVGSSDRDGQQDVNNNHDCESGNASGRSTWPRKAADSKLSDGASSTSPDDSGRCSSRRRLPVWRKRPSLSGVQQMWAEQSLERTTTGESEVEQNANNSPPSAASSYDPLDNVNDNDGYIYFLAFCAPFRLFVS